MNNWPTKKLGEICEEKKEKNVDNAKIPVFTVSHIYGLIQYQKIFYKQVHSRDTRNYKIVKCNDFAFGLPTKDTLPFGYLKSENEVLVSPAYTVFSIKDKNLLYPKFLFYLFKTEKYKWMVIEVAKSQSATRHGLPLKFSHLENLEIPLPPLPIQRKIARILDTIQSAIDIQEKIIEKIKELKKSLMNLLFHYGPKALSIKLLASYRVGELKSEELEKLGLKLKKTEIGEIPEDWEIIIFLKSLDKQFRFKVGKLKQRDYQKDGEYPIIDQGEKLIAGYSDDYDKVYQGDLPVVIFGDHTRVVKYVDFPFIVGGGGVKILKPNDNFDIKYFYYLLLNLDIESRGYNRHFRILKDKLIPLPPLSEQQEIAEILQTVDQKIEIEKRKKELYEELFKTMLNKIMKQEVDVELLDY